MCVFYTHVGLETCVYEGRKKKRGGGGKRSRVLFISAICAVVCIKKRSHKSAEPEPETMKQLSNC